MTRDVSEVVIRRGEARDLPALVEIDNYYILETPITFHTEAVSVASRTPWFEAFGSTGRYQLFVAEHAGRVIGYAGTTRFRPKAAYGPSVETTVYLAPDARQRGTGGRLYERLFAEIEGEDIHRLLAGITLPNPASLALHARMGFTEIGVFHEIGRKFDRYWDVVWLERALRPGAERE